MPYNDKNDTLLQLYVPSLLSFSLECFISAILLVVINFTTFENSFFRDYPHDLTFSSYSTHVLDNLLAYISQFSLSGQIIIFLMWIFVGMFVYVLLFRLFHIIYSVSRSVNQGVGYIKTEHSHGIVHWFSSLHNFFFTALIILLSFALFGSAIFLAFVFAAQNIQSALTQQWPHNAISFGLSYIATVVGVRLLMIGVCVLLPRFRRWYVG